ncbi:nucleotidyltransferase domain-containing protein [Sediminibacillus albus]|uniref:Nucleotidyltransferase domain-containing protein n=1 Tax=Sediminibacillus albus TaxID=407036 RepID=A0A1G8WZL8_9BACI|nr:nucleotidyltransferase domain-containing protein [Sediminibacillus albus]SDJ83661.1 Nucleotidyltransferase domain-containing protein [Sediminibacillus albus]
MKQDLALERISASLREDPFVQAIFVKGSMGRGEHDGNSDIDLYCLVEEEDQSAFLAKRLDHLQAYSNILFYDDIFIIAPQIIAVYENLLHVDLFTVTENTFLNKDYFRVIYDPQKRLDKFKDNQKLTLASQEFLDDVTDVAWFLLQYRKTALRGNDLWAVAMLHHVVVHLARVLLHRYAPARAQLGLKTLEDSLPPAILKRVRKIFQTNNPENHDKAAALIIDVLEDNQEWLSGQLNVAPETNRLLNTMMAVHSKQSS